MVPVDGLLMGMQGRLINKEVGQLELYSVFPTLAASQTRLAHHYHVSYLNRTKKVYNEAIRCNDTLKFNGVNSLCPLNNTL